MDVNQLLEDIAELEELGDEMRKRERRPGYGAPRGGRKRGGYFQKAAADDVDGADDEADAHGEFMTGRHSRLASLHDKISALHSKMSTHYADGAKGAHTEPALESGEDLEPLNEADSDDEPTDARAVISKVLRSSGHFGDPSRAGVHLVRARERGRVP